MAATLPPTTKPKKAAAPETSPARELNSSATDLPKPGIEWGLGRAWLLRMLWGPVASAAEAIVRSSDALLEGQLTFRVLIVGRRPAALRALLLHTTARRFQFEVRTLVPDAEPSLPFEAGAFDCVIALDWLAAIRPSQRESAVVELCRIARLGVLVANPFYSPEVAAAERAVNSIHFATKGEDNRDLGRHLEYGLPELERVRGWIGAAFPYVTSQPIESLSSWQVFASVAVDSFDCDISDADAAVAALLPPMADVQPPAYRSLIAGASTPLTSLTDPPVPGCDFGPMATHLAIEAAAQRGALDRLTTAITSERDREREQFQATVASLADEIHEREAHTEVLVAELNALESVVADQTAVIEGLERRLSDTDTHALSLELERDVAKLSEQEKVQALSTQLLETETRLNKLTNSKGWRLLSRYGRIKYRYLLPVYRALGWAPSDQNDGKH
ncbi:MAG TPA: hypothetical protein VMS31_10520 [Pyrinomonadaceae bacterium]|nr:hypothetical protein [Pyrinomonadaceae bacterium]